MANLDVTRREFLGAAGRRVGIAGIALTWRPPPGWAASPPKTLRFGLAADVHKDIIHDADQRLTHFIERMQKARVEFIMQMGDFCIPHEKNRPFLDIFNRFEGPRYHMLGNHDMDGGFTRAQTMAYWGMRKKYYSFDAGEYHFVVLDGNDKKKDPAPGYARYVGRPQREWLKADLNSTSLPTFVFSHQSLENPHGVENRAEVRTILEQANDRAGWTKVVAAMSGHHHIDYLKAINGIHYVQINSMSYYWVGGKYTHERFDAAIEKANPYLKYTVPYKDPLFALVTIHPEGRFEIKGVRSSYIAPSPAELAFPDRGEGNRSSPNISDRRISFQSVED